MFSMCFALSLALARLMIGYFQHAIMVMSSPGTVDMGEPTAHFEDIGLPLFLRRILVDVAMCLRIIWCRCWGVVFLVLIGVAWEEDVHGFG